MMIIITTVSIIIMVHGYHSVLSFYTTTFVLSGLSSNGHPTFGASRSYYQKTYPAWWTNIAIENGHL